MRIHRIVLTLVVSAALCRPVAAQQRPLATEDPEVIGAGRLLIEGGIDAAHNQHYPLSGLQGNLWRVPVFGVSIDISPIAEIQFDGGFFSTLGITERKAAPLSGLLTITGDRTDDVEDFVIGTKVRLLIEGVRHPSLGFRFATRLPNASNESGMGLDTMDFLASLLAAKTVQSVRVVGNIGFGILGDPLVGYRQNDVLTYGASFARALTNRSELVGELNGRVSTRTGAVSPGTETRGTLRLGGRHTRSSTRFDVGLLIGLTTVDPTIGFTTGFTYVFQAFNIP